MNSRPDNFISVPNFSSVIFSVSWYASLCFFDVGWTFCISGKMASAVAPSFRSSKETTNYVMLCRLLVDVRAHILRKTFDKRRPTGDLKAVLSSPPVHAILNSRRKKQILSPSLWRKLYPAIKSSPSFSLGLIDLFSASEHCEILACILLKMK